MDRYLTGVAVFFVCLFAMYTHEVISNDQVWAVVKALVLMVMSSIAGLAYAWITKK